MLEECGRVLKTASKETVQIAARKAAEEIADSISPNNNEDWISKATNVIANEFAKLLPIKGDKELDNFWKEVCRR